MGFLGVKTYRKRLTGAVRSFLSYSEVISGRFGEKQFFDFSRPLFEPISNHIGPNLALSGTKSPNLCMYMSCCLIWHHRLWRTSLPTTHIPIHIWHLFLDTRYPCVSVDDQLFMGVCRPDIHEYLWSFFSARRDSSCYLFDRCSCPSNLFEVTFYDPKSYSAIRERSC